MFEPYKIVLAEGEKLSRPLSFLAGVILLLSLAALVAS